MLGNLSNSVGRAAPGAFAFFCALAAERIRDKRGSNDITVVDLATGQTRFIPVGNAPRKIVVQRTAVDDAAAGAHVSIANFAFAPAMTTILAGQSLTWSNDDGAPHGLKYKDGAQGLDPLLPGETFSRTFDRPGTYDYACSVHPYRVGTVEVRPR